MYQQYGNAQRYDSKRKTLPYGQEVPKNPARVRINQVPQD